MKHSLNKLHRRAFQQVLSTGICVILIFSAAACNDSKVEEKTFQLPPIENIPASDWENIKKQRIYFGHQSVGNNILDGLRKLINENPPVGLRIVEAENLYFKSNGFYHSKIGKNGDPGSKIDAFADILARQTGRPVDIAFFKFCFVDINADTDIRYIFDHYKTVMSELKGKYPRTVFVHFTVPLLEVRTTIKTWIKRILRKKFIWEYDHSVKINEFNDLIRKEYSNREPIFDLAEIESTLPNGERIKFVRNGKKYHALSSVYTNDGGHLNTTGQRWVSLHLLNFLVKLNEQPG